jgi:preprotein translocase subunit YajC
MFNFLLNSAYAEAAPAAAATQSPLASFAPLMIVFVIFYFLVLRPQGKKLKQEQAFINNLNKGDEVYTKSGILGTIYGLTDEIVTLEVSEGARLKVLRSHIAGLSKKLFEAKQEIKAKDTKKASK